MEKRLLKYIIVGALLGWTTGASAFDFGDLDVDRIVDIGKKVIDTATVMPEPQEIELGRGVASRMLGASELVRDDEVQNYVNQVGRWLSLHTDRPDLPWSFGVLDTPTVGAFAMPGGYIFITRGLMQMMDSEAQLAGVLAHEIGHVIKRHHLYAIRNQAMTKMGVDLLGKAAKKEGYELGPYMDVGMEVLARGLDRDDEFAADRLGVVIATRAGYEPYGLPRVLLALHEADPDDESLTLLFDTHPPTADRLARLEKAMQKQDFEKFRELPQLPDRYLAIREQLAALN